MNIRGGAAELRPLWLSSKLPPGKVLRNVHNGEKKIIIGRCKKEEKKRPRRK